MDGSDNEILQGAIERNSPLVLSLPSAGMLHHHRSRFLGIAAEAFWVEMPAGAQVHVDELIGNGQGAGVSFKAGETKVVFATPILRREMDYRINGDATIAALLVRNPEQIKTIQRRSNYRVRVSNSDGISVRIWRMGPGVHVKDRPSAKQELKVKIRDLSVGGIGVTLIGEDGQPPKVSIDDRLRVELTTAKMCLLMEGNLRHPVPPMLGDAVRAGIQFKALEKSIEGRQILATLTRIVGELHRDEIRRYRLGVATAAA